MAILKFLLEVFWKKQVWEEDCLPFNHLHFLKRAIEIFTVKLASLKVFILLLSMVAMPMILLICPFENVHAHSVSSKYEPVHIFDLQIKRTCHLMPFVMLFLNIIIAFF